MSRQRRRRVRNISGIVVLDKANGLSSNAALQEVKRLYEANKAGHAGSLDPLATGVLPVCLGEATKVSQFLLDSDKRYRARIKLGIRTDTGDSEGSIIERNEGISVSRKAVERALTKFKGEVEQVPPMHSAIKMNGVPLYKLARKGITVEREPRLVTLYQICLVEFVNSELELEISCSKGTYIRTIADDLGQELGCGAHVIELRRTQAGVFTEKDSISSEELALEKENRGLDKIDQFLIPMDRAIQDLPEVNLPSITASHVKNGQAVLVRHLPKNGLVRMYEDEQFIGIGSIDDDGKVAPKRLIIN
ncbi:MAG: tRNA pseudouridine(55) synthase TruB [Pseudomonadota bacterium]|nr:tRNA pseudouridine(55) synthase TruB [Pseudomonadales bacterium]MEC9223356.1 tRNA pseudouridine(55) synthase TruB [Pseudomonadota bacterium]MEE2608769.1 tRNA pseudouridine(55) synthase TruB [Pseudomonadota bacterium]